VIRTGISEIGIKSALFKRRMTLSTRPITFLDYFYTLKSSIANICKDLNKKTNHRIEYNDLFQEASLKLLLNYREGNQFGIHYSMKIVHNHLIDYIRKNSKINVVSYSADEEKFYRGAIYYGVKKGSETVSVIVRRKKLELYYEIIKALSARFHLVHPKSKIIDIVKGVTNREAGFENIICNYADAVAIINKIKNPDKEAILNYKALGYSNKEIAFNLGISQRTLDRLINSIKIFCRKVERDFIH